MVTFNSFEIRTDESGKTFLDLEVKLSDEPHIILQYSFPASSEYYFTNDVQQIIPNQN